MAQWRGRGRKLAALAGCGLLGLLLGTGAAPANAEGDDAKLLLLLDSSGSMAEKTSDGTTKIAAAKKALNGVVEALPEDAQVGMRLYGATVYDQSEPGACKDTDLVVPIGTDNRKDLTSEISKYKPYGETPIAYSLAQAAKDLGDAGQRTILLVSDGEETCAPDPCETAEKIAKSGIDLKVDVVGFDVSGKAEKQLRCIADKGSGDYYDVDDTEDLESSLDRLTARAFRPFALSGTEVQGSAKPADAPEIGPGDWVDRMPAKGGEVSYYRIRRSSTDATLWVGTTLLTAVEDARLRTTLAPVDDPEFNCGSDFPGSIGGTLDRKLITGLVSSHSDLASCPESEEFLLEVGFTEESGDLSGEKFQLRVGEEPPREEGDTPPPAPDPAWTPMEEGDPQPVEPGNSFSNAPAVESGTTYGTELMPGEIQTVKIEADAGERIQVLASTGELAEEDRWIAEGNRGFGVDILSPYGGSAHAFTVAGEPPPSEGMITPRGGRAGAMTKEIRWANRESGARDSGTVALPGEYYVTVHLERVSRDEDAFSLPVNLTVQTLATDEGQQPSASPSPPAGGDTDDGDSGDGPSAILIGGVAAVGVVLVGAIVAGVLVWRRRRRPA